MTICATSVPSLFQFLQIFVFDRKNWSYGTFDVPYFIQQGAELVARQTDNRSVWCTQAGG
jgi:hypothetical protein